MPGALTWDPTKPGGELSQDARTGGLVDPSGNVAMVVTGTSAEVAAFHSLVSGAGIANKVNSSILQIGGDHCFLQWQGTNGNDGAAAMHLDLGIKPYIAICADESTDLTSGYGATPGKPGMLTVAQCQALEARGVEFVSHGTRHMNAWALMNTGIRVYYTGAEATPTVNISGTQLTTSTATTGATAFTWATYPTLTQLAAAINALAGWNCILATELAGTEPSAMLVPLRAARSVVDAGGADPTDSNQRFALSAGIHLRYTGTAAQDVAVSCNAGSNFLSIFVDGARVAAISTAATLQTVSNAINALNVPGLASLVMDNGYGAQTVAGSTTLNPGQKFRETYCIGDEDALSLSRVNETRSVNGFGLWLTAGLGPAFALRRQLVVMKERAASLYGLTITSFAQSGNRLPKWMLDAVLDVHDGFRSNMSQWDDSITGLSPNPVPLNMARKFSGYVVGLNAASATPYSEADVKAFLDALADCPGWLVDWCNHLMTPTPLDPSPYTGLNQHAPSYYVANADEDEGPHWRNLQHAASLNRAGSIEILAPTVAAKARMLRAGPSNLIFNHLFRNGRAGNLLGITNSATGAGGIACPGVSLATASSDYSAVTVDADHGITLTTNGALGANKTPLGWNLMLEPGKTYVIGADVDLSLWGAANSMVWALYALYNSLGLPYPLAATSASSERFYGGAYHNGQFRFTVPLKPGPLPARAISIAGPYTFGGSDSITIALDARTASAAISLAGLTTARQVAAAINTAIDADATYAPLGQYKNLATVVDNRVVIQGPSITGSESLSLLQLSNSVGTPLAVLFGAGVTTVRSTARLMTEVDASFAGYRLALSLSTTAASQTLRLINPYCREVAR